MSRKLMTFLAVAFVSGSLISAAETATSATPAYKEKGEKGEKAQRPPRGEDRMKMIQSKFKLTDEENKALVENGKKTNQLAKAYKESKTDENLAALKKQITEAQDALITTLKAAVTRLETAKEDVTEHKVILAKMEADKDKNVERLLKMKTEDRPMPQRGEGRGKGPKADKTE